MIMPASTVLRDARRIVVKVGSSLVTNEGRGLDEHAIGEWCRQLATLVREGREVLMVSSGAALGLIDAHQRRATAAEWAWLFSVGSSRMRPCAAGPI